MHQRMPSLYFDGSEPLAVLTFLRQLKVVFDESGITKAMGSRLLFDFVRRKASKMLEGFCESNYQLVSWSSSTSTQGLCYRVGHDASSGSIILDDATPWRRCSVVRQSTAGTSRSIGYNLHS
jgi:hypothetical protein